MLEEFQPMEFFENNFTVFSMGRSLSADPNIMDLFQGVDSKLRPNGYR